MGTRRHSILALSYKGCVRTSARQISRGTRYAGKAIVRCETRRDRDQRVDNNKRAVDGEGGYVTTGMS